MMASSLCRHSVFSYVDSDLLLSNFQHHGQHPTLHHSLLYLHSEPQKDNITYVLKQ